MHPGWRVGLGAVVGVLAAGAVIAAVESVGHRVASTADGAVAIAVAGYGAGGFMGALVAQRIALHRGVAGWTVIAALATLAIGNTFSFAHPRWYVPAAIATLAIAGVAAARAAARR
jgi:hypothetical protein